MAKFKLAKGIRLMIVEKMEGKTLLVVPKMFKKVNDVQMEFALNPFLDKTKHEIIPVTASIGVSMIKAYNEGRSNEVQSEEG